MFNICKSMLKCLHPQSKYHYETDDFVINYLHNIILDLLDVEKTEHINNIVSHIETHIDKNNKAIKQYRIYICSIRDKCPYKSGQCPIDKKYFEGYQCYCENENENHDVCMVWLDIHTTERKMYILKDILNECFDCGWDETKFIINSYVKERLGKLNKSNWN